MFKNKKRSLILMMCIGILSIVILSGCLVFNLNNRQNNETPSTEAAYTFPNSHPDGVKPAAETFYSKFYNSHSEFIISSKEGYSIFRYSLSAVNYSGKAVYLSTNLTLSDDGDWMKGSSFAGTFDGQGHYINAENLGRYTLTSDGNHGWLFENVSGYVVNLEVRNVKMKADSVANTKDTRLAVLAGINSGTIYGCIVRNCDFVSNRAGERCKVAPLVARNEGTVTNCLVRGSYKLNGNDSGDVIKSSYFVANNLEATYSIFKADVKKGSTGTINSPSDSGDNAISRGDVYNYDDLGKAQTAFGNTTPGSSNSSSPWYIYPSDYSYDGCGIYLRAFIGWFTLSFDTNGDDTCDATRILPLDYLTNECAQVGTSSKIDLIFDSDVSAVIPTGYNFAEWEEVDDFYWKATFSIKTYAFDIYERKAGVDTYKTSITSYHGSTIDLAKTNTSCSITGSSTITYEYFVTDRKYIIGSVTIPATTSAGNIYINLELKDYNITFG